MSLEDRVRRLEQRADASERIELRMDHVEQAVGGLRSDVVGLRQDFRGLRSDVEGLRQDFRGLRSNVEGLRQDFDGFRAEQATILSRILASLEDLQRRPMGFRWPWGPIR